MTGTVAIESVRFYIQQTDTLQTRYQGLSAGLRDHAIHLEILPVTTRELHSLVYLPVSLVA
jgi:hypothetical protein